MAPILAKTFHVLQPHVSLARALESVTRNPRYFRFSEGPSKWMVGWVSEEIFVYSVHEGVIGVIGVWIVLIRRKGRRAWLGAEGGKEALRGGSARRGVLAHLAESSTTDWQGSRDDSLFCEAASTLYDEMTKAMTISFDPKNVRVSGA